MRGNLILFPLSISGWTVINSYKPYISISDSLLPHNTYLLCCGILFVCLFVCLFFGNSHPNSCEMVSHCGFDLHLSKISDVELFHIPSGHSFIFFREMSIQLLCPFLNQVVFLLLHWRNSYVFCTLTTYQIDGLTYFLLFRSFPFTLLFPLLCRSFLAWYSTTCLFFILLLMLLVSNLRHHCQDHYQKNFPYIFF